MPDQHASTSRSAHGRIASHHCTRRANRGNAIRHALHPATRPARNCAIASADWLAQFVLFAPAVRTTLGLAFLVSACAITGEGTSPDDLTSVDGNQAIIDFDGFVDVAPGASDAVAKDAIHRELKSALGALREQGIGIADRDAQRNLATMALTREPM
jgi:hypothetical protein